MGKKLLQIAIDGPIGSGKSTVARLLAEKLNLFLVDAGALYRTAAYLAVRDGLKPEEYEEIARRYRKANVEEKTEDCPSSLTSSLSNSIPPAARNKKILITLDGEDISDKIRTHQIDDLVAKIAKNREIIDAVHEKERKLASRREVVIEGREVGTMVLPNAQVKVYLTADTKTRARRRFKEYERRGNHVPHREIIRALKERDELDMRRAYAPLRKAEDAVLIDTADISAEEAAEKIINLVPAEAV